MAERLEQLRALGFDLYLWAQRRSGAAPGFLRAAIRNALADAAEPENLGKTGKAEGWENLLGPSHQDAELSRPLNENQKKHAVNASAVVRRRRVSEQSDSATYPKRRCVVATAVLGFGGLDKVAALLGRRLPLHGFDTAIVYFDDAPAGHHAAGERLVDGLRLDGVRVVKLSLRHARRWLRAYRPDVISMHGAPDWFVDIAADADIPIIETLHGAHTFFGTETWPKERVRSKKINGLVAVSDLVRLQYLRINPAYPGPCVVTIPNGVDEQIIVRRDREQVRARLGFSNEFLFVSLARYHLQKNTFGLVAAFSDVARVNPNAHLLIAGHIHDAAYFEQVRRLRDGLPCAGQIHLREHCPDVSAVLAAADAFVLNSFFEGWSLASMEALFAGLPVVMSDVGGAREQIGENRARGFIVRNPLGDADAIDWVRMSRARFRAQVNRAELAEAMCAVISARDYWKKMRGELQAESVERFSAERCVRRHADVLAQAAAREVIGPASGERGMLNAAS